MKASRTAGLTKRSAWKVLLAAVPAVLIAALLIGTVLWMQNTKGPSEVAIRALESDGSVLVTEHTGMVAFEPAGDAERTGFAFYPGAGVDFRSYAPVLRGIAARGYIAVLLQAPLNLAFFDTNAAEDAMRPYPGIEKWAVGGHSLGGVAAAGYAATHPSIAGLVLWASYPGNDALRDAAFPIVSIYGSQDGLASISDIEASRAQLPGNAQFVEIEGGNHAQFGSYGSQPGDSPASISAEEQWAQIVEATVALLERASH